jgi:acylphosphatase
MGVYHWKLQIFGRVQGVAFRAYARDKATKLGLFGYVKNEPDGSVLVEIEGSRQQLLDFYNWSKKGPAWARVEKVNQAEQPVEGYTSFSIRY